MLRRFHRRARSQAISDKLAQIVWKGCSSRKVLTRDGSPLPAAKRVGLERVVHLGGFCSGADLAPHLASRKEVRAILRTSGVPTIELRASIVTGSGSLRSRRSGR
jgi:uncharacterized protein YbjT (DUF2867 family)